MQETTCEPGTEKPKGAMWKEEAILEEVICRVAEKVSALEHQLSPVLRDQPPQTQTEATGKDVQPAPDFVQRLRGRTAGVKEIEMRLASLLERLEI